MIHNLFGVTLRYIIQHWYLGNNSILTSQFNFGHAAQNSNFSVFSVLSLRFLMLQVHIEQGPVLEWLGFPLGVVKGIAGQTRLKVHSVFTFQNKYKKLLSILFT
jgi:hypothetical protein